VGQSASPFLLECGNRDGQCGPGDRHRHQGVRPR